MTGLVGRLSHVTSIFSKLSLSIALFFIAARVLGPERYGEIAKYFAYGALVSQIIEYGSCQKLIRDSAKPGERVEAHIWSNLLNKAPALIVGGVASVLMIMGSKGAAETELLVSVIVYFLCNSYIDLLLASQRSQHKFIAEAVSALTANFLTIIVSVYFLICYGVIGFCYSLMVVRVLVLILLSLVTLKDTRKADFVHASSQFLPNIKDSFYYGLDSLSSSLIPTLTLLGLSEILAPVLFGQYQLIQKIIQGCNTLSMIATQKHFPLLASRVGKAGYDEAYRKYYLSIIFVSVISVISVILLPLYYHAIGLVSCSAATVAVLVLLIVVRYQAAYQGVRLTVERGAQMKSQVSLYVGMCGALASMAMALLSGDINLILLVEVLQITIAAVIYVKHRAAI